MTGKIFRSMLAVTGTALLVGFLLIFWFLYDYFGGVQTSQLREELDIAAVGVETSGLEYLHALKSDSSRLTWIAADGTVLYDAEADRQTMSNHRDREEVQEALTSGEGTSQRYSHTLLEKTTYCARRLSDGSVLRISISTASMTVLAVGMMQPVCAVALASLLLAFLLASRLAKRIVEPLNRLDLDHPLDNDAYEEITPLLRRISQQRRQLDEQMRIRQEFTANVSHELRTPLTAILGSSELLRSGMVQPEDVPRFVGHIHDEADRLLTLIEDIIRLSQLDEGAELPQEMVDLSAVVTEVAQQLGEKAAFHGVSLHIHGASRPLPGVPRLFHEIVYNLMDNAIKYNVPGGSVTVTVTPEGVLTVADTGIGIPEEHQSRVFERFYRVDKSHSRAIGGTGLGLSIVKHAAAYLHASLSLTSCVGQGTTVQVTFTGKED